GGVCGFESQTAPATSYPREESAARYSARSSWAEEEGPLPARPSDAQFRRSRPPTGRAGGGRTRSAGLVFSARDTLKISIHKGHASPPPGAKLMEPPPHRRFAPMKVKA